MLADLTMQQCAVVFFVLGFWQQYKAVIMWKGSREYFGFFNEWENVIQEVTLLE